ncbi:MAG: ribosomal protein S18-alanine N-acetyltransferase [Campylobacterales bacterium]
MNILAAARSDLDALCALENRAFGEKDWLLSRRVFAYHLGKNPLIKAEINGALAGYALLFTRKNSRTVRLYALGVDPAFQGQGIGRALLKAAIELARKQADRLTLEVRQDNAAAIGLYEKFGFQRAGLLNSYYPDGADGWRMSLGF